MSSRLLTTTLACWTLALLAGCSSFSPAGLLGPKVRFADAEQPAADVICMWEPGEGRAPDGKPARGFMGTVLFFDREHTAPVGVHGKLTFYVFDDYGPRESWSEPIAEYSFAPQQWDQFFGMGALGPSYRIFIPYPRKHPYQVNTSVWAKYEPADGGPAIYSRRTPIALPGPLQDDDRVQVLETAETRGYAPQKMQNVVAASFEEAAAEMPDSRIQTIHRWDPAQPAAVLESSHIDLANYEVTRGDPAGAIAGLSESAPGARAESWGSPPPALSSTPAADAQPHRPRKRFKLTAPE